MKKSFLMILAAAAVLFGAFSCSKPYDDSELRNKISSLETRISKVEALQQEIDKINETISKLNQGLKVTSVSKDGEVVTINFSDGTSVNLSKTIISVVKDEKSGEYCWAVNGALIKDPDGNVIPVGTQAPKLRAAADGTLEFSIDGGKTWNPLAGKTEAPTLEETDDAYIIHFGESSISLPKNTPFYIRFAVASNFSIAYGETADVKYEVVGGTSDTEVGILVVSEGIEAQVADGVIKVTNNNKTATTGRVVAYAADHKGKSDIKTLVFLTEPSDEPAEFTAVIDGGVEEIVAEGGTFYLSVKADEDYTVSSDVDWIVVSQPTRALYEDRLAITVQENPTTEPRTGNITLRSKESDLLFAIEVKQAAGEEPQPVSGYESFLGAWNGDQGGFYVQEYVDPETEEVQENVYNFIYDGFFEGENIGLAAGFHHFDDDDMDVMYFQFWIFDEDEDWYYIFCGVDADEYIEFGGPEQKEVLAWGVLDENGALNIIGNEYEAVYSGTTYDEVIVSLSCYAYRRTTKDNYKEGDIYSFNSVTPINLPAVFTKAEADKTLARAKASGISLDPVPVRSRQNLVLGNQNLIRK